MVKGRMIHKKVLLAHVFTELIYAVDELTCFSLLRLPIVHQSVSPTKGDSGEVKLYVGNIPLAITKVCKYSIF